MSVVPDFGYGGQHEKVTIDHRIYRISGFPDRLTNTEFIPSKSEAEETSTGCTETPVIGDHVSTRTSEILGKATAVLRAVS